MLALNDWVSSEYAVGREVSAAWARAYVEAHGIIDSIGQPWLLESFGAYGSFLVKLAPTAAAKLQQALSLEQALLTWRRGCPPLQAVEAFTIALDIALVEPAEASRRGSGLGSARGGLRVVGF